MALRFKSNLEKFTPQEEPSKDPVESENEEDAEKEKDEEDEELDWGYLPEESIFDLKDLKFKPFTTALTREQKYYDACDITSNLYSRQFLQNLDKGVYKFEYYDKPYSEYNVQDKFLKKLKKVKAIEFIDVDINADLIQHFSTNKDLMKSVTKVTLKNCNVDVDILRYLLVGLKNAKYVEHLDLSNNPIGDAGFNLICTHLYDLSVSDLSLFNTQFTYVGLDKLTKLYKSQNLYLTKLNFGHNNLDRLKIFKKFILTLVRKRSKVEELLLSHCGFGTAEMAAGMAQYLTILKKLEVLDLSYNLFSEEESLLSLAEMFITSKSLKVFNLSYNPISDVNLKTMIDFIFDAPLFEEHKTLILENVTIPQSFFDERYRSFNREDLTIVFASVRKIRLPKIESLKYRFVKRFHYLYKKGRPKKDMVISIIQENIPMKKMTKVKSDTFKETLMLVNPQRIPFDLVQEIVNEFTVSKGRANAMEFIEIYDELFPPKPPKEKKKKKKKDNKKKK